MSVTDAKCDVTKHLTIIGIKMESGTISLEQDS